MASVDGRASPPTPLDRGPPARAVHVRRCSSASASGNSPAIPTSTRSRPREKAAYAKPAPDVTAVGPRAPPTAAGPRRRGTFDGTHETVLRNQIRDDNGGVDVLTPLRLRRRHRGARRPRLGAGVVGQSGVTTDPPPTGTAVVHGLVHDSNPLSANDTVDHLRRRPARRARVDLAAIGAHAALQAATGVDRSAGHRSPTPTGNAPALPQPPPPDPVNHMEYAIEWFAFALIPLIGWPIALRRLARQRKAAMSVQHREHREQRRPCPVATDASAAGPTVRDRRSLRAPTTDHSARVAPTATLSAES